MQPIAFDTEILRYLFDNWDDSKLQREFYKLSENLEVFHQVFIDKSKGRSEWFNQFREIRDSLNDQNIKKTFDELIGPRNIKYVPVKINQDEDYLLEITRQTPDKIGLSNISEMIDDVKLYNLPVFNSNVYNSQNFLFRIPKSITILPGEKLSDLRLFTPYVRDASKVEFCDLFLFKNPQYEDDSEFLFSILNLCSNIKEVEIHCEPNNLNFLQKKVESRLKKDFGKNVFKGYKKYNPPTKDLNHDRFIIIDDDKFSIRFTTSFNNFRKSGENCFKVVKTFLIEISNGRKYYD